MLLPSEKMISAVSCQLFDACLLRDEFFFLLLLLLFIWFRCAFVISDEWPVAMVIKFKQMINATARCSGHLKSCVCISSPFFPLLCASQFAEMPFSMVVFFSVPFKVIVYITTTIRISEHYSVQTFNPIHWRWQFFLSFSFFYFKFLHQATTIKAFSRASQIQSTCPNSITMSRYEKIQNQNAN